MTAYMPYKLNIDEQEAEAKILGSNQNAVPQADPRLYALERNAAGNKMDREIMLGKLGMQKKEQDFNVRMGQEKLKLGAAGLKLRGRAQEFDRKMTSKANVIAKWGVAMNLAFGATGFIQRLKNSRKMDEIADMQMLIYQAELSNLKKQKEELET